MFKPRRMLNKICLFKRQRSSLKESKGKSYRITLYWGCFLERKAICRCLHEVFIGLPQKKSGTRNNWATRLIFGYVVLRKILRLLVQKFWKSIDESSSTKPFYTPKNRNFLRNTQIFFFFWYVVQRIRKPKNH